LQPPQSLAAQHEKDRVGRENLFHERPRKLLEACAKFIERQHDGEVSGAAGVKVNSLQS